MLKTSMGLKSVYDPEALNRELALVIGAGFDTVDLDISEKYPLEMLHDGNYLARAKAARRVLDDFPGVRRNRPGGQALGRADDRV